MRFQFTGQAKRDARHLDRAIFNRIKKKLKWYLDQEDPIQFAEKLTDSSLGDYRFRIGDYRVIFDLHDDLITVIRMGHRREIYRS